MLIYLGPNPYFPEGTLFDLDDTPELTLPDRGDGTPAIIDRRGSIVCPPFAENIPPGQCPVVVTSYAIGEKLEDIARIKVDESIHFQVLVIPQSVVSILVNYRVRSVEVDSYFPSANGDETEYRFHISHLRPGFYEALITFADGSTGRLTFIKFFPARFSAGYPGIRNHERPIVHQEEVKMIAVAPFIVLYSPAKTQVVIVTAVPVVFTVADPKDEVFVHGAKKATEAKELDRLTSVLNISGTVRSEIRERLLRSIVFFFWIASSGAGSRAETYTTPSAISGGVTAPNPPSTETATATTIANR